MIIDKQNSILCWRMHKKKNSSPHLHVNKYLAWHSRFFQSFIVDFLFWLLFQIIKNEDLEELRELGSGTFGTVYHGKWRGTDVAIKRIKKSCFTGRSSEQERLVSFVCIMLSGHLSVTLKVIDCTISIGTCFAMLVVKPWVIFLTFKSLLPWNWQKLADDDVYRFSIVDI